MGVMRDEAMQIAKNNLASLTHRFSKPGNQVRVYVTDCDDDYGASRLLLRGRYSNFRSTAASLRLPRHGRGFFSPGQTILRDSESCCPNPRG